MSNWFWDGATEAATVPIGALTFSIQSAEGDVTTDPEAREAYFIVEPNQEQLREIGRLFDQGANPDSLIAASQVVAIEFQTIAAANKYWQIRPGGRKLLTTR